MKRGIILIFMLILIPFVASMEVTLVSPSDSSVLTDVDSTTVTCKAVAAGIEELDNLTLYIENNESYTDTIPRTDAESNVEEDFDISGLANATYTWNCLAVDNESVQTWFGSNYTFVVTFSTAAPNNPPNFSTTIPDLTWEEDVTNTEIDLNDYFNDSDGDPLTFDVVDDPSSVSVSIDSNGTVSLVGNANWSGTDTVSFSASDGTATANSNSVSLNITPVNDAPLCKPIPNQTWYQNMDSELNIGEYFSDIESSSLTYSYNFISSGDNINASIDSESLDVTLTPKEGWTGTGKITFTAMDEGNLSFTSNEVFLKVLESGSDNSPPVIDSYLPETNPTVSLGESQTFTITKSDSDGDTLTVAWYVDNVLQENDTGDSFTFNASTRNTFAIKVAVSDNEHSETHTWTLTVSSDSDSDSSVDTNGTSGNEAIVPENATYVCGDNVCHEDETFSSCCKDCGCPDDFMCNNETNKCLREVKTTNRIMIILLAVVVLSLVGIGIYFYLKKKKEESDLSLTDMAFKVPPKKGEKLKDKTEKKSESKIVSAVEKKLGKKHINAWMDEKPKEEEKEIKEEKKEQPKVEKKKEEKVVKKPVEKTFKKADSSNQLLLKKFISSKLKKGQSLEQIKKELLKVGWSEEQIQDAYTAAQLDEVFDDT